MDVSVISKQDVKCGFLKYGVIGLTYLGLAIGYFPSLRMNRATIALVDSAFVIALGVLSLKDAWQAIDSITIVFLLRMMIVNASLSFGCGVVSTIFLNDTIALIFTPLVLSLAKTLRLNPVPYLLVMAGATDIESVATLSGGEIPAALRRQIEASPIEQLKSLREALLNFCSVSDLEKWLSQL